MNGVPETIPEASRSPNQKLKKKTGKHTHTLDKKKFAGACDISTDSNQLGVIDI